METTTDDKGREKQIAVYHGNFYEILLDERGIILFRRRCLLLLVVFMLLHTASGFVQNRGMFQFYISIPYVLAFFPFLYAAQGAFHLPRMKRLYRRDEVGLSFSRLKTASTLLLVFLGIGLLGELVFLIFVSSGEGRSMEYLYLALDVPAAVAVFMLVRLCGKIHVQLAHKVDEGGSGDSVT